MFKLIAFAVLAVVAFVPPAAAQPLYAFAECSGGAYYEVKPQPDSPKPTRLRVQAGDVHCQLHPGWDALALAIDVGHSNFSGSDRPGCQTDVSNLNKLASEALKISARQAASEQGVRPEDFDVAWKSVLDRAAQSGGDVAKIIRQLGGVPDRAVCQGFVLRSPVPARRIRAIFLGAHQGGEGDQRCGEILVNQGRLGKQNPDGFYRCAIGHAGWEQVELRTTPEAAVVSALFSNWSHDRERTGLLWIYYDPAKP